MKQTIIDNDGTWYTSTAAFPMFDPISGAVFNAGEQTKVKENDWIKGQPCLVSDLSPEERAQKQADDEAAAAAAVAAAEKKAAEDAEAAAKAAAAAAKEAKK